MSQIISFKNADIVNGENVVIYDLNMDINSGDVAYIVGKVGTGKTSIIRTIIAENHLTKGEGTVCGYDLRTITEKEIPFLRRKLGIVFQDFQLLMDRNVSDNLEFVLRATGWKEGFDKKIVEVLEAVGMEHKIHKMPHQLSGGEQQRIAIARALLNDPEAIIADEPTGNLDAETAEGIRRYRAWLKSIGMPQTFKELGAKEEDIPKLVATLGLKGNTLGAFRPLDDEDVANILRRAASVV